MPDRVKINMTSAMVYNTSRQVIRVPNCCGFMFTNVGDTIATVNGMVIFPSATPATALGDSRTISMQEGEEYVGNIDLSIRVPLGAAPAVELVQMFYAEPLK